MLLRKRVYQAFKCMNQSLLGTSVYINAVGGSLQQVNSPCRPFFWLHYGDIYSHEGTFCMHLNYKFLKAIKGTKFSLDFFVGWGLNFYRTNCCVEGCQVKSLQRLHYPPGNPGQLVIYPLLYSFKRELLLPYGNLPPTQSTVA